MDSPYIQREIKILKSDYIVHMLMLILLSLIYIIFLFKYLWLSQSTKTIFFATIIVACIFIFIPVILFLIISFKKLTEKLIKKLEIISIVFLCLYISNSLLTASSLWYNSSLMSIFYQDCPYNFNISDILNNFYQINDISKIKRKCNNRRCFPINDDSNIYICNFKEKNNQQEIIIGLIKSGVSDNVKDYLEICGLYTKFFESEREKYTKYSISSKFICPNKTDIVYNYILTYMFIFTDLLSASIQWIFEYLSYRKIRHVFFFEININNRHPSLKDTNNTSKIEENNNQNNENGGENNSQNFKRQPTEILIIENNKNKKNDEIKNDNNEERIVNIFNNTNEININEINNNDIISIKGSNNIDKSEEQLMNNKNIFKAINKIGK